MDGLELVLDDGTRVPLGSEVTIGRGAGATVVLDDATVSRLHVRIADGVLSDAGSSYGTWVDGVRVNGAVALRDGARIRLGDRELQVQGSEDARAAGATIVVPAAAGAGAAGAAVPGGTGAANPRLRPGYALKRLAADEGSQRWVLRGLETNRYLRFGDEDAWLLQRLDGQRTVLELLGEAQARYGADGPPRLARLLAELGERGLLADVEGGAQAAPASGWRRLVRPREKAIRGAGRAIDALYRAGGQLLFTRPAVVALTVLAVAGLAAFVALVADVYGTPFVVADKVGLGGLVFLLGRLAIAGVHELAHGLAMASLGRRVERAGLKAILIFPYAFVDTSEAWFEGRRRRIAVSMAGPASDFALGAAFAIGCLAAPAGTLRDILFNLAFAAYVGGFFNLNPFIERDGYHVLVDILDEPDLRRRAKLRLDRRLRGAPVPEGSPALSRYGVLGVAWLVVGGMAAIALSLRYWDLLRDHVGHTVLVVVFATLWVAVLIPAVVVVGRPLVGRIRGRPAAVEPAPRG